MSPDPWNHRNRRRRWPWLVAIGGAFLVAWLVSNHSGALDDEEKWPHLVYLLLLLAFVGSGWFAGAKFRPMLRHAAIWLAIGFVIVAGYAYRFEFKAIADRVMAELVPGRGMQSEGGTIAFRGADNGHFRIDAQVEGTPVRFMVDTGASLVTLSPRDAERIGFDLNRLSFTTRFRTANGEGFGALVTLREVRVGPIRMANVRASVNRTPMSQSLLGMSFLERLSGFEVRNGTLTLSE